MLILYKPWTVQTQEGGCLPDKLDWFYLCKYSHELEGGTEGKNRSFLKDIRSQWMQNASTGLRISAEDRLAAMKYRIDGCTEWNQPDGSESFAPSPTLDGQRPVDARQQTEEEEAALEAQMNIDNMRSEAALDDLFIREDIKSLQYLEATSKALNQATLTKLQLRVSAKMLGAVLIDEISNFGPAMLGQIDKRLRQIMENDLTLRGLAVILMGNFFNFHLLNHP